MKQEINCWVVVFLWLRLQLDSTLKGTREMETETKTEDFGHKYGQGQRQGPTVPNLHVMSEVKRTCSSCET